MLPGRGRSITNAVYLLHLGRMILARKTKNGADDRIGDASADSSTRQIILDAAARCYEDFSTARTTIEDISKASGLSRVTIYRYFSSKDQIAIAVLVMKSQEISRRVVEAIKDCRTTRARIIVAMTLAIEFLISDRQIRDQLGGPFFVAVATSGGPGVGVLGSLAERWLPILEEGIADGTLRPDLDKLAAISWITDVQMMLAVRILSLNETLDDVRTYIEQFVLDGITQR